jgi:type I restriction enzyme M protein
MASSGSDAGHSEKLIRKEIIDTGAVDVMVSIGNKFFYSVTLPCALWFFDRAKEKDEVRKDQVLMLDLRNVYRKVSSSLHDFTEEHLDNIHAIVGLYRGDNSLFNKLVEDYKANDNITELEWLTSRFPEGKYVDIDGLCKIANRTEIADNDYSLTPGRYVGVEDQIDHDFDYETEMGIIKKELNELNAEANVLADQIKTNLNELGL